VPHFAIHADPVKKEVICWIASEEGKAFSVEWLDVDVDYPSAGYLYLDGQQAKSITRQSHSTGRIKFWRGRVSESSKAPFLFSKLVVTDDDTCLDTPPSHYIGEIKFVIERTTVPKAPKAVPKKKITTYLKPPQMVHERSKKAIAHQVNFGSEIPVSKGNTYRWKTLETLVTFIFKYRPLEMLRANDIVPRNPELLEPQQNTPPISEKASGKGPKGEYSKLKKEAESGSESDDEESTMRGKALLSELEKIRKGKQLKDKRLKKKVEEGRGSPLYTWRDH